MNFNEQLEKRAEEIITEVRGTEKVASEEVVEDAISMDKLAAAAEAATDVYTEATEKLAAAIAVIKDEEVLECIAAAVDADYDMDKVASEYDEDSCEAIESNVAMFSASHEMLKEAAEEIVHCHNVIGAYQEALAGESEDETED